MDHRIKVVTAPTEEPVTLAEAKAQIRETKTAEDTLISNYIKTARRDFEEAFACTVIDTTYDLALDDFPSGGAKLKLPRATPLIAVSSVKYTDSDGNETTWDSSLYDVDTHSYHGSLIPAYGETYPSFTPRPVNPIFVRYNAGVANAAAVDERIKQYIMMAVGLLFENREFAFVGEDSDKLVDLRGFFMSLGSPFQSEFVF